MAKSPKRTKRSDSSDEQLKKQVLAAIQASGNFEPSEIKVHVSDGEVFLEGRIPDRPKQIELEEMIDPMLGVEAIHDRLIVERPELNGETPHDRVSPGSPEKEA